MKYDDLLLAIDNDFCFHSDFGGSYKNRNALRAVVELCQQAEDLKITGVRSTSSISTELLIQTIEKELA
jgi:hypothetical protein